MYTIIHIYYIYYYTYVLRILLYVCITYTIIHMYYIYYYTYVLYSREIEEMLVFKDPLESGCHLSFLSQRLFKDSKV